MRYERSEKKALHIKSSRMTVNRSILFEVINTLLFTLTFLSRNMHWIWMKQYPTKTCKIQHIFANVFWRPLRRSKRNSKTYWWKRWKRPNHGSCPSNSRFVCECVINSYNGLMQKKWEIEDDEMVECEKIQIYY